MSFIKGIERILYIKDSDTWMPVAFLTSNSWESPVEFIPTTTRDNAGYSNDIPISQSNNISFSAIAADDVVGKKGYQNLIDLKDNRTLFTFKLSAVDRDLEHFGKGHISNLSETADADGLMTFDGAINVYGKIEQIQENQTPIPPTVKPPTIPTNIAEPRDDTIRVEWDRSGDRPDRSGGVAVPRSNAVGFEIIRTDNNGATSIIDVGSNQYYEDIAVVRDSAYTYNVRSYDISGKRSGWSPMVTANIATPTGETPPNYMLFEDGTNILSESGQPLIFE